MSLTMMVAAAALAQPISWEGAFWQDQSACIGKSGNRQCRCPSGMSVVGVDKTAQNVDGLDAFECAKPAGSIGTSNCETVTMPNSAPWPTCPSGKVMTGIHTNCGGSLNCIDVMECCDFDFPPESTVVSTPIAYTNWWACLDRHQQCEASGQDVFLSGFYRNPKGCTPLYCIEGAYSLQQVCAGVTLSTTGGVAWEQIAGETHTGLTGQALAGIPAYLQGAYAFFPPVSVADGTDIELDCCGSECTFFVAVYHCSPCSSDRNGKLIGELLGKGWEGSSCAPNFVVDSRGYPMTILHKTTTGKMTVTTEGPTDFLVIFKTAGGVTTPLCHKNQGPSVPGNCNTQCAP